MRTRRSLCTILIAALTIGYAPWLTSFGQQPSPSPADPQGFQSRTERTVESLLNPHGNLVFKVTKARTCADCHRMEPAARDRVEVLDNAAVRGLIAQGKGAHKGRFADCFRCHAGGRLGVEKYVDPAGGKPRP